ncbi:hypothetical protein TWF225_008457 [Orbilia oligospora]|nr:hypothetical protein TWF225_008457 [Orbilia oligospora]KAF3240167.1 hypothetical protein TWF217_001091 [Orbilia oligospora]KAF3249184.1 hypothetical protein TWF128_007865 [Orbilia oligospora]
MVHDGDTIMTDIEFSEASDIDFQPVDEISIEVNVVDRETVATILGRRPNESKVLVNFQTRISASLRHLIVALKERGTLYEGVLLLDIRDTDWNHNPPVYWKRPRDSFDFSKRLLKLSERTKLLVHPDAAINPPASSRELENLKSNNCDDIMVLVVGKPLAAQRKKAGRKPIKFLAEVLHYPEEFLAKYTSVPSFTLNSKPHSVKQGPSTARKTPCKQNLTTDPSDGSETPTSAPSTVGGSSKKQDHKPHQAPGKAKAKSKSKSKNRSRKNKGKAKKRQRDEKN